LQKELELVQLLASLNEKIDTVEKQLKHSTDLSIKIERLVEDVSSIKSSMGELQFMLMGDGQNMGIVTRVAGLEKNFDDRERFMEKTVEPAMEKQQRILFDLENFKEVVEEDKKQRDEIILLKERVSNVNKILWIVGSGTIGLMAKAVFSMIK
jgi:hypothetical protein|tara:strand:- start:16877 stop:17335 length:459 start_codon:yes stop_codon:yes gene_type:complete